MKKIISIGIVSLLVIGGFLGIMNLTSEYASAYTTHDPIYIDGNAGFTPENGTTGGNGTQSNPYIIEGWDINATSDNGIMILNTDEYFIIKGCYVYDGSWWSHGIYFYNVTNGRVENTISSNNWMGIYLDDSSYNNISNSNVSNNMVGIYLVSSSYNTVSNSNVSNNMIGIDLDSSSYNTLVNNTLKNDGVLISGGAIDHVNTHNIDTTNTVNGKPIYYYKNQSGINIDGLSAGQVILANCTNFTIKNVNYSNVSSGVELAYCNNCSIENSVFNNGLLGILLLNSSDNNISNNSANSNNWNGIYLSGSNNNVYNNSASNNYRGIYLLDSSGNNIFNNSVNSNSYFGIYLDSSSSSNTISNNSASYNGIGIYLEYSSRNNILSNNNVNSNDWCGIYLNDSSYNNIYNNIASNNYYGIYLSSSNYNNTFVYNNISYNDCSVEIHHSDCENNTFHHNNFINGSVVNVVDNGVNTTWDDGSGEGNYWSNYTGLDDGTGGRVAGDGVGDTNIPHMGLDNYPLMTPWGVPPTIISVTPQNLATNIPVTTNIVVIFSEPMNQISTQNAFTLETSGIPISGTFSWNLYNDTMTFDPTANLLEETTYWVNITTEAKDLLGDSLSAPWASSFTTEKDITITPPTITDVTAIPDPQEIYGYVNISANVSDNVGVDTVWISITDPNGGTVGNFTMNYDPVNDRYCKNQTYDVIGTYHFIIWANDISDNWNSSLGQFTMQDTTPPATPIGLTVTDVPNDEGGALNITWNLNTDDTVVYTLYSNNSGSWQFLANVTHPQNWYVDAGLTNNVKYYYKISAWDEVSLESPQSATVSGVPADNLPPSNPTGLTAQDHTNDEGGAIDLDWDDSTEPDLDHYDVYRSTTSGGPYTWLAETALSEYTDSTTTDGITYYYVVTASDEVPNESGYSNEASASSLDNLPQGTISGVVKDEDGNPIEGATVTIYESGTTTDPVASTTTDSNGEYSVDVSPGMYDIKIEKSGYETQWKKDVEVTADQTTTVDFTLPLTTDILRDYWWMILIVIIIIIIIIVALIAKKKL